jgi:hypothetical protein
MIVNEWTNRFLDLDSLQSMNASTPTRLLFCHIPKAGGSTMGQILAQNLGKAFFPYYGLWDRFTFVENDVHQMFLLHPQISVVGSHMLCLRFPLECPDFSFHAFSFVRHPVERAISHYSYTKKLNPQLVDPDINQFFAKVFRERQDGRFFNNQFRFLSGRDQEPMSWEHIKEVIFSRKVLLAPLDRFDDACIVLENRFPQFFQDASYALRENTTTCDQEISDEIRQIILDQNPLDWELYQLTQSSFEAIWKEEIGDNSSSVAHDFRKRCENRAASRNSQKAKFTIPSPGILKKCFSWVEKEKKPL